MQITRRTVLRAALGGAAAATLPLAAGATHSGGSDEQRKAISHLGAYADQHRKDWGIPGMVLSVVGPGGFEAQVFSGLADVGRQQPVTAEHLFQIGSISKMIAALTVWSQVDEGLLSPEQTLQELMPEINVRSDRSITLKQLLDHTSGLPRDASPFIDGGLWTGFSPGSHWAYCNLGYKLIGMIAARSDGTSFAQSTERRVLRPLQMNASRGAIRTADRSRYANGYELERIDRPNPLPAPVVPAPWVDEDGAAGCIAATAGDMCRFLRFLLGLGNGKGGPLFSDETARRFLADPADAPGWSKGTRYGNGLAFITADGRPYLHHTGGMISFTSSLHVDVEAGVAAFASANIHYASTHRPRNVTQHACNVLRATHAGQALPEPLPTRPGPATPERFAGRYIAADGSTIKVTARGDQLLVSASGQTEALQIFSGTLGVSKHPAIAATGLAFHIEDDKAVAAWAGATQYLRDAGGTYASSSPKVTAIAGHYVGESRWSVPGNVYAQGEGLLVTTGNYVSTLAVQPDGDWVSGDPATASDWTRFDAVIDGRPQRASWTGDIQRRVRG